MVPLKQGQTVHKMQIATFWNIYIYIYIYIFIERDREIFILININYIYYNDIYNQILCVEMPATARDLQRYIAKSFKF